MSAYRYIPSSGGRSGQTPLPPLDDDARTLPRIVGQKNVKQKNPPHVAVGPIALRKQTRKFPPFGEKTAVKAVLRTLFLVRLHPPKCGVIPQ
jgi:hypothetical protein